MGSKSSARKRFKARFKVRAMRILHNQIDKKVLKQNVLKSKQPMKTISFYRYYPLKKLPELRDTLYLKLSEIGVLGRIYLAKEGINAQVSIPEHRFDDFEDAINAFDFAKKVAFRFALEEKKFSFYKLKIKLRKKIVADGINEPLDLSLAGEGHFR